jgi:arylsulfatase A-like enzyme
MSLHSRVAIATALLLVAASAPGQNRPPNIVVIVGDDMGYADIGFHGSKDIPTPNLDALARAGVRFTDGYVTGPYCSPTRAGLLTGRYQQRFGHEFNMGVQPNVGLPLEEKTLADRLKAAGYRTALFGKWHLGADAEHHPMSRGFDEFFGFLGGAHSYLDVMAESNNPVLDGRKPAPPIEYLTDAVSDRAVDFIKRNRNQPFFLYVAFNAVHTPTHATDKYLARFKNIADAQRRTYAAMLSAMDDGIGRTIAALRENNLEENTLIVFFSDNGGPTMQGTTINGSSNAPLRGSKRQTWEGGIRVPFVIRWKGKLPENKVDSRPIIQLDVFPTVLAAAGIRITELDGVNLLPFLTTQPNALPHDALYWRLGSNMAIRRGDWKLVLTDDGPLRANYDELKDLTKAQLFNLKDDIGEKTDLSAKFPDRKKELAELWQRWNQTLAAPRWGAGRGAGAGSN